MKIKMIDYGKRISAQEIGLAAFERINLNEKTILDFTDVDVATTAFFNSFISELLKHVELNQISDKFGISNANEQIKNNLLISLELSKYYEE